MFGSDAFRTRPFHSRCESERASPIRRRAVRGLRRTRDVAKGRRPLRLRRETSIPGRQRIPRTARTSKVLPSPTGRQGRGSPRALAVEQDLTPGESAADDVRPLRVRPAGRVGIGVADVQTLEHRQRAVEVASASHPPGVVDAALDALLPRLRRGPEQRRDEVLAPAPPRSGPAGRPIVGSSVARRRCRRVNVAVVISVS